MWGDAEQRDGTMITVKPDATPEEVKQVLETENPQIFSQAVSARGIRSKNPVVLVAKPRFPLYFTAPQLEPIR